MKLSLTKRVLVVLATVLAVVAIITSTEESERPRHLVELTAYSEKQPLPAFTYLNENKDEIEFDSSFSALTVVHFWATWCSPCLTELPELDNIAKQYKQKNIRFLPIAIGGSKRERVRELYRKLKIKTLPIYLDPRNRGAGKVSVSSLPTTLVINTKGEEIARAEGEVNWANDPLKRWVK